MTTLTSTYRNQGCWKEAEELALQVIETSARVRGLEDTDVLSSIASIASIYSIYQNRGRWEEAEELEVQAMDTSSKVLRPEHS